MRIYIYIYIYIHTYTHTYMYIYMYIYTFIHTYLYVCVYMYIHAVRGLCFFNAEIKTRNLFASCRVFHRLLISRLKYKFAVSLQAPLSFISVSLKQALLQKITHILISAFRAPTRGLESSFCCCTAGQGLAQKEHFFHRQRWATCQETAVGDLPGICVYVYMCMCVYVYVCMYVCMHACKHACMYVCMYLCMYVCMYVGR